MSTLDNAFASFMIIDSAVHGNRDNIVTEEDSKLQIITRILVESLGWTHDAIRAERRHDNGFSDYVIHDFEKPKILVEAKRIRLLDIRLANQDQSRTLKLNGPALSTARSGITQAAGYASPYGIPLAALTDGLTWIIFKPHVTGEHFLHKEGFIFPSPISIKSDYSTFFDLLSRDATREKRYTLLFDKVHNPRMLVTRPLTAAIEDSDINRLRKSEIAFDLDRVFDTFFSRMRGEQDPDLLIECFVETRESRIADFSLEKMTRQVIGNVAPENRDVDQQLSHFIGQTVQQDEGESVFIIGPTGSGKTTFLERFFRKTLPPHIRRKVEPLRINFLDASGESSTIQAWMTEQLIAEIEKSIFLDGIPQWDDLLGLYFNEYRRRSQGVDAVLYKTQPEKFREKFGEYMDERVEHDREGYLRRLLIDIVKNRKKIPVIIVDNTDEFDLELKKAIFQYSQALRRHAKHCIVIQPVTDKSAWSFSKTDIFGIYSTKSFFLPTPPPREVFRKRIDYIKRKIAQSTEGESSKQYLSERGIRISIGSLERFASELEAQFVNHERSARLLGEISNYNIRTTLELAQRVMTSAVFKIENILAARVEGKRPATSWAQFMNALLKGDYEFYRAVDIPEILNVFQVDEEIRQSPLLRIRVLILLRATANAAGDIEGRHLTSGSIHDYFEVFGCTELAMDRALEWLIDRRLIEKFDPSVPELEREQKLAITYAGRAHLKLALEENIYFEQMALTTRLSADVIATELRDEWRSQRPFREKCRVVRSGFASYLLSEDVAEMDGQRGGRIFEVQDLLDRGIERHTLDQATEGKHMEPRILRDIVATVDWFSVKNGYGFADCTEVDGQVYLNNEALLSSGLKSVSDGDDLLCSVVFADRGPQVLEIQSLRTEDSEIIKKRCRRASCKIAEASGFSA